MLEKPIELNVFHFLRHRYITSISSLFSLLGSATLVQNRALNFLTLQTVPVGVPTTSFLLFQFSSSIVSQSNSNMKYKPPKTQKTKKTNFSTQNLNPHPHPLPPLFYFYFGALKLVIPNEWNLLFNSSLLLLHQSVR